MRRVARQGQPDHGPVEPGRRSGVLVRRVHRGHEGRRHRSASGSQQQWYTRNSTLGSWQGGNWNMTFSGVQGAPANDFSKSYTTLATTPTTREKPYLFVDFVEQVPRVRAITAAELERCDLARTRGAPTSRCATSTWRTRVTRPRRSTAHLAQGLNLFFTPGTYQLNAALNVTRADTVVTGIGFPTLVPTAGNAVLTSSDVAGVNVSNLVVDAGPQNSDAARPTRRRSGSHVDHAADPQSIQDVFFRVGSSIQGRSDHDAAGQRRRHPGRPHLGVAC